VDNPWPLPNFLFYATALTEGSFVPIRPPCDSSATPTDFQSAFDMICNAGSAGVPEGALLTPGNISSTIPEMIDASGMPITGKPIVDNRGRLLCDIQNRSTADQVKAAISEILSANPFILVDNRT